MKLLTLGEDYKLTGKSKPTISKVVRDGRLSGRKNEQGVYKIEASELFRVYPAKSSTPDSTPTAKIDTEQDAVAAMTNCTEFSKYCLFQFMIAVAYASSHK